MENYTIAESYTLPSKGIVYGKDVNPNIRIRSMKTEDEMKRLGHSDYPYKVLTEIIDDCLIEKIGISAYDLCIGDYQFLLHKLRVVTYGKMYNIQTVCPICGAINKREIDLEALEVSEYSDDLNKYLNITLPRTGKKIELRMQTPRMLDDINSKAKDLLKKSPSFKGDPAFLFTLESLIAKVDGEVLDPVKLSLFVRDLPMADANYILRNIEKVKIGVTPDIYCTCNKCRAEYKSVMPYSGEFFGPDID